MPIEVRRVSSLADRAAVVRLRADIAARARSVYGGTSVSMPEAAVTGGTFAAFHQNLAVAAVDAWFSTERAVPADLAERVALRTGGPPVCVLDRVHLHPDHRDKHAVEALLGAMADEAAKRRIGRILAVSDFPSLPAFRAAGFHPEGPARGATDEDDLYITSADVELDEAPAAQAAVVAEAAEDDGHLGHSTLVQLERILPSTSFLRMIDGGRVPRSGRTGQLVVYVVSGSVEIVVGGRPTLAVRAGEAIGEASVDPGKVFAAGPHGAVALALSPQQIRDLAVQHPEVGARVAGAVVSGLIARKG